MFTIRNIPENEFKKVDVPYEVLSVLEKFFHFKDRKNQKIQTIVVTPKPIVIIDKYSKLSFNQRYNEVEAAYVDETTGRSTFYTLYDLEPYGILGDDKICACSRFELDVHRVSV